MTAARFAFLLIALGLAFGLLFLSAPLTIAHLHLVTARADLAKLRHGKLPSKQAHRRLIRAQEQAIAWGGSGQLLVDHAYTRILGWARGSTALSAGSDEAKRIEGLLTTGLARSPVNADGWRWLAVVRLDTKADRPGALAATRMSLFTGPLVRYLVIPRLRLCLELWDIFPEGERESVYRQIRYAWRNVSRNAVIDLAARARTVLPFQVALSRRPRDLLDFQRALKRRKAR
ncbi:MAG: hypothetical protein P8Z76_20480 [Alphaproteobacteria bacterium]